MVRLPMDIHQGFANLRLYAQTNRPTVHAGNRPPFSPDLAPEPQTIRFFQQSFAVKQFVDQFALRSFQAEESFYNRPVRAFTDAGCVHPRAEDRTQCVQNDGFSGACLTGKNHQSRGELKRQIIDNCEIADAQLFQHNPSKTQPLGLSVSRGGNQSSIGCPPNKRHQIYPAGQ